MAVFASKTDKYLVYVDGERSAPHYEYHGKKILTIIMQTLIDCKVVVNAEEWTLGFITDAPLQDDAYSCGPLCLSALMALFQKKGLNYKETDMALFRDYIATVLFSTSKSLSEYWKDTGHTNRRGNNLNSIRQDRVIESDCDSEDDTKAQGNKKFKSNCAQNYLLFNWLTN